MRPPAVLVVGLGHSDRGDDAVGAVVAREVAKVAGPSVEVLEQEDPTDLALVWAGREHVVVVDAMLSGGTPGTVRLLHTGAGRPPLPTDPWAGAGQGGTHAFGLAAAVELSRALGRLPDDVTVVGVEAEGVEHGAPLSPRVAEAIPAAVAAVLGASTGGGRGRPD
jgi:hydrogenase maturation protease